MLRSSNVTLAEVARQSGVGLGTASRALRDAPGVAPATRDRVRAVAEQLSFVASPEASSLARGTTGRVAIVVPHLDRWFFGAIVTGLGSVLRDADLDVLLYQVGYLVDRHAFFEQLPARRKVDALVVVAFPIAEPERARLDLMGVRVVAAGGQSVSYPFVSIDDVAAGRQVMSHLLNLGHTRIAMIGVTDPDQPAPPSGRTMAYETTLSDAGIPLDPALVRTSPWGGEEGAAAMGALLGLRDPPTAVYAHSDEVAVGAMRTLRRAGLRIPEDLSIVGIDDHPLAALVDLTTVRQPVHEQGRRTGELLLALLRGESVEVAINLPTELVVRGSTAPPGR